MGRMLAATFAMLAIGPMAASAQAPLSLDPFAPQNKPSAAPPASLDSLKQRDKELEALRTEQRKTLEKEAKLKREIELMGDDRRKFNQQIIETTARVAAVEDRIAKTQARIEPLDEREEALRGSLQQRRNLISELLAALQRIGREAPPALLIRAEDALQSVRSALVLGAVLPEVRQQAEILSADLGELVRLRMEIAQERDKLARDLFVLAEERGRQPQCAHRRDRAGTRYGSAGQARGGARERGPKGARRAARSRRAARPRAVNPRGCLLCGQRSPAASGERGENQGVRGSRWARRHGKRPHPRGAPRQPDHSSV
jgi:septal ring factor EnvC (AmiA/AmiB activator)